jgi:hypothetical protein
VVFLAAASKGKVRPFVGLLQTVVAVALFFVTSLDSFTGSGWLAVSQPAGVVLIKQPCRCSGLPVRQAAQVRFGLLTSKASRRVPRSCFER